ncbi:MAG: hypothetical protein ACLGPL_01275 [Acidobacteriota bacterium]
MRPERGIAPTLHFLLLLVLLATLSSCQYENSLAGRYEAVDVSTGSKLHLLLGSDGKGRWSLAREETLFTWEKKGDEVWLHSKTGGVLIGKIDEGGALYFNLPGIGEFRFEKEADI